MNPPAAHLLNKLADIAQNANCVYHPAMYDHDFDFNAEHVQTSEKQIQFCISLSL